MECERRSKGGEIGKMRLIEKAKWWRMKGSSRKMKKEKRKIMVIKEGWDGCIKMSRACLCSLIADRIMGKSNWMICWVKGQRPLDHRK